MIVSIKIMDIRTAFTLVIGQLNRPVITSYDLGLILFRLYQSKTYKGEALGRIRKDIPSRTDFNRLVREILENGVIQRTSSIHHQDVYLILGKETAAPEDIACSIDPFAYISHMSAMEWHGLTDRIPKLLFLSAPAPQKWRKFALDRMRKDLGEEGFDLYKAAHLPGLRNLKVEKISRKTVNRYASIHLGAFTSVKGRPLRVSSIGRTFLDMIREPDLCGGIYHVIECFEEHAKRYLKLIVDEVERHGTKIDRVRAGYILEERCGVTHLAIEGWVVCAERGGSRKLYAKNEYSPDYSEKWCLSINIEE